MPIYEYVCSDCDSKFEKIQSMSKANESAVCSSCNGTAHRVLSKFACFSADANGVTSAVGGGSSCASCAASHCESCSG